MCVCALFLLAPRFDSEMCYWYINKNITKIYSGSGASWRAYSSTVNNGPNVNGHALYQTEWFYSISKWYKENMPVLSMPPPSSSSMTMKDLNENGRKSAQPKIAICAINKPKQSEIYYAAEGDSHTVCVITHWAYMLQINCLSKFQYTYISPFIRDEKKRATIRDRKKEQNI